ncbi:MAG: hypoxanthine-guanine phosphoribosyltransferase [Gammaproteobacteria bacterium]|nr:MAG: hypoxanthine-guanine phosphoribosyltransferase [Gammaproteobacteria bacterium]
MASSILEQMQSIFKEADCLYSQEEVTAAIHKMADQLTELADARPIFLVVMNGGLIFAGQLLPCLPFPLQVDYVHASRYGTATRGQQLRWIQTPRIPLRERAVVLVDDIYDEGATLLGVMEYCLAQGARSVKTCVLVEKIHDRKARPDYRPDYCGLAVPDRFVFGYGLDYQGYWRNAPGIYAITERP